MGKRAGRRVSSTREMEGRPRRRFSIWARSWALAASLGAGGAEGDAREVAGGEAGDRSAGSVGVEGDGGGGDEAGVDDVAVVGVAVAEEVEEVGWGHGVSGGTVLLYRFGVVGCWLLERDLREAADAADSRRGIRIDAERALRMRWSVFSL